MAAQICETCKKQGSMGEYIECYCSPNSTCEGYEKRAITWLEKIKLMDIEEMAEWLDQQTGSDTSPWIKWWDSTYCQSCATVMAFVPYLCGEHECAYCEVNDECRFFSSVPDNKEIIKMWLESEEE